MRVLFVVPVLLLLTGCASEVAVFDARACPREKVYSKAHQLKMADALPKSPPIIQDAIVDYGKLRDAVRACRRAG
jgi:hypothetical protein